MLSLSSSRLFPSWFFLPSKPPIDNVMDEHTPSLSKTKTARAKRQQVFDDVAMKDGAPTHTLSVDNVSQSSSGFIPLRAPDPHHLSSANSIVIGEGTEQLAGDTNLDLMPETMIKLFCWIFGEGKSFPVKISPDETVGDLKEAIVAKKPNRLQGIDAVSL